MATMTDTSMSTKACCSCGADVTGQRRMKDSQGRYWCVPCGEADERKKQLAASESHCAGCRKTFAKGKLNRDGEHFFCKACLKKRTRVLTRAAPAPSAQGGHAHGAGSPTNTPGGGRAFVFVMVALLAVFAGLAVLVNFISF